MFAKIVYNQSELVPICVIETCQYLVRFEKPHLLTTEIAVRNPNGSPCLWNSD